MKTGYRKMQIGVLRYPRFI